MDKPDKPFVEIYTDGACSPNPGVGGWAAILVSPDHPEKPRELSGAEPATTNNRMELTAAVRGLEALKRSCKVQLTTDSEYVQKAFTEGWLARWQRNGWKTASKKPVANADLWRELVRLTQLHDVSWHWVRGHAEHPMNSRCDELAVAARLQLADDRGR
jgi:ribonuclease HI